MPKYLITATYTSEGAKGLLWDSGTKRREAAEQAIKSVGGFKRVATFPGGQSSVMDLSFDRETGYLWAYCDNTCGNRAAVLQIDALASSPARGRFTLSRLFDRPGTMPDINNEGIAIAPEAECSNGRKAFIWADDAATGGNSLRRDAIPCGRFF